MFSIYEVTPAVLGYGVDVWNWRQGVDSDDRVVQGGLWYQRRCTWRRVVLVPGELQWLGVTAGASIILFGPIGQFVVTKIWRKSKMVCRWQIIDSAEDGWWRPKISSLLITNESVYCYWAGWMCSQSSDPVEDTRKSKTQSCASSLIYVIVAFYWNFQMYIIQTTLQICPHIQL